MTKKEMPKKRLPYSLQPWGCNHHSNHSELTAYVEASGEREFIAKVYRTSGMSAELMSEYLCNLVNDQTIIQHLLAAARDALELCLSDNDQSFSSEQAADSVLNRIKERLG